MPSSMAQPQRRPTPSRPGRPSGDAGRLRRAAPTRVDRILIIRLGALGDVVRTLPAARAVRALHPGAHLTWLVEPAAAGVVEAADVVDETMVLPRRELVESMRSADWLSLTRRAMRVVRHLRERRFDLVLDFHGIFKSGLLARLSGAPVRYGFGRRTGRELSFLFVNRRVELGDARVSRYERNAALVRALDPAAVIPERPFLAASALARARLSARLAVSGREAAGGFVLMHPGSSAGARHKRYAPAAWAEVARALAARGVEVWLAAGATRDERRLASQILAGARDAIVQAPETRSFDDLLALVERASVFVSADSGPLHAASLAGVPVVQLLGPTDPFQNQPWDGSPSARVHVALPCSPCRRGCEDASCMRVIPPSWVVEAIERLRTSEPRRDAVSLERSR
jgi:ADP-heptose:LPS heptosyltransferase